MKKYHFLIIVALILGLVLTGCSLLSNISQVPATGQSGISYLTKGTLTKPDVVTLIAGQTIPVGTVSVWNDGINIYVQYETTGDWVMTETHLAVATTSDSIPQNKNDNPIPGHFQYNHEDRGCIKSDPYTIPLSEIGAGGIECEELLYIAAHALVQKQIGTDGSGTPIFQTETAWAEGVPFADRGNWATYFTYKYGLKVDLIPCPYNYPDPDNPPPGKVFVIFCNSLGTGYNFEMTVSLIGVKSLTEYDLHLSVTDTGGWSPNKVGTIETDGSGNAIFNMSGSLVPGQYTLGVDITLKGSGSDIYETLGVHPPYIGDPVMIFYQNLYAMTLFTKTLESISRSGFITSQNRKFRQRKV